jgi:hypothetical protein
MNARLEIRDHLLVKKMKRWLSIARCPLINPKIPTWRARKTIGRSRKSMVHGPPHTASRRPASCSPKQVSLRPRRVTSLLCPPHHRSGQVSGAADLGRICGPEYFKEGEGGNGRQRCAGLSLEGTMKLKKPLYQEGVDFDAACIAPTEADELFELMTAEPFVNNRISYGPQVFPVMRKSNGWKARYAWATNHYPEPRAIRSLRLRLAERYGVPFNSVQANWHDGASEVKAHYDPYRVVAMVRLGAQRNFEVGEQRRNGGRNFKSFPMPHGSLITFLSGGLAHRMFPDAAAGPCISLVFRLITPPQTVASWHDKPTYNRTRAEHRKLYDAAVAEYREGKAKAQAPNGVSRDKASPIGEIEVDQVTEAGY